MNDYSINCNASRHKNGMDDHQSSAEEDSIYTRCLPFSFFFRRPTVQIPVDKKKKGKKSKNIDHENNVSPMSATTKLKFTPVIVKKERVIIPINADGSRSSAKPEESSSEANNDAAPRADKVEFVNGVDGNVIPINTVDSDSSTGKSFARSPGKNSSIHLATSTSENPDMSREKTFSDQDDITSQKIVKLIPRSRTNSPSILNVDNSSTREGIQPIVQSLLGDTNSQKLMCNDSSFSGKRQNNEYEDMAPSIDSPSSASFMPLTSEESNCNAVLDGKAGRSRKKSSKKDVFKSNYDAVLPERRTYNDKNVSLDGSQRREHPVSNDVCSTAICNREYNKDDNLKVHSVRQVDQRADAGCILS